LMEKVQRLEVERDKLVARFAEVEAENQDFASRYVAIENENNNLLNIYVASYQLHSTLDFQEVLQILTEIILNFVGAEIFAIGLLGPEAELRPLVAEGVAREDLSVLPTETGVIGEVVSSGEPVFEEDLGSGPIVTSEPGICVPLKIKGQVIGVVLIYRFLQQKKELAPVDHELFTLLAGHAATAIFSSKLYTDSKRKLKTIQGFIDLMTSEAASG
ncbi:GAF domain-containing protein, partial [Myxococcota bacterium]